MVDRIGLKQTFGTEPFTVAEAASVVTYLEAGIHDTGVRQRKGRALPTCSARENIPNSDADTSEGWSESLIEE